MSSRVGCNSQMCDPGRAFSGRVGATRTGGHSNEHATPNIHLDIGVSKSQRTTLVDAVAEDS